MSKIDKLLKSIDKKCPDCNINLSINCSRYFFKDSNGFEHNPKYSKEWYQCNECNEEFILYAYFNQEETKIKDYLMVPVN